MVKISTGLRGLKSKLKKTISLLLSRIDVNSEIHRSTNINRFVVSRNSKIDRYSYVGPRTKLERSDIGSFCSISWDCHIGLSSHDLSTASTSPIFTSAVNGVGVTWTEISTESLMNPRTLIGSDVWIGARAIVMEGVEIGSGAVVAAGSIVTKAVAPYSIVAGVPAKHIKYRFPEEERQALLDGEWWNADEEQLKAKIAVFQKKITSVSDVLMLPRGKK